MLEDAKGPLSREQVKTPTRPDGLQRKEAEGLEHLWEGKSWARQNHLTSWVRVGERENSKVRSNFLPVRAPGGGGAGLGVERELGSMATPSPRAPARPRLEKGPQRGGLGEVRTAVIREAMGADDAAQSRS